MVRSLIIDNKDYNYTLIITGTTFQIVHHDTNKNATYTHGIEVMWVIYEVTGSQDYRLFSDGL